MWEDLGSIPGLGRSPGEGNGNPLQCSCLENPMDRGAWWATVRGVTKSWTRLSDFTILYYTIRCVQFSSVPQSWVTLYDPMDCSMPGLPVHPQLLELAQTPSSLSIKSVMPFNHLVLCCPLLLLPSIFASIRVFSSESVLHIRWPRYWSFSFSISPSNKYSGQISFMIDWLDVLAVQGTLKSLLQHHISKASVLPCCVSEVR